jgi:hypothetical protein
MSFHRASHLLAIILPGLCLSATHAFADPADTEDVTNKPPLQVALRNEEFLGTSNDRQVRRVYLTLGTNQFALTVPEGYRVDASDPQKMVFSDAHDTCFISFHFMDPSPDASDQSGTDSWRNLALSRYPDAIVTDQTSEFAGSHAGQAYELRWVNSGGAEQAARIVFIPSRAGVMEFNLISSPKYFDAGRYVLRVLLASLRTNEGGRLEITPLSDKS